MASILVEGDQRVARAQADGTLSSRVDRGKIVGF
jgi:hypothetical protein